MVISYVGLAFGPMLAGGVATIENPQSVMLLEVLAGIIAAIFSLGIVTNHLQYDPDSELLAGELL